MLLSLIRMIQAFGTISAMSANCPSLAIASWPISALIVRTFRALQPGTITADRSSAA